jgi:hypothetical protein
VTAEDLGDVQRGRELEISNVVPEEFPEWETTLNRWGSKCFKL